ncbi:hypothetical protein [Candidatus Clostridium radicumherbarum]|uniref:DUF5673 domain-containing protein n=1 Tax=Candidatus Clostridium radicumherbarum TaxID=3381662 RepID=A0ABW8TUR5_9CLOT
MNIISSIIIIIVVSLFMSYLMSSSKKEIAANEEGFLVFKMNKAYGIVGTLGIIAIFIVGIIASLGTVKTISGALVVLLISILLLLLCLPLLLVSRNQKIMVSDEKILFYSMTGKLKEILWTDINEVKFNKVSLELKLITNSTSIKLHMHLVGFNRFLELMEMNLSSEIYRNAMITLQSVQKRYS